MTTLVLHVGDHKTGTSSLQRVFAAQAYPVLTTTRGDLVYPRAGRGDGKVHHNLAWDLSGNRTMRDDHGGWAEFGAEVAGTDAQFALLSTESLEGVDPAMIRDAVDKHLGGHVSDVRVIAYVRPHGDRILSSYAQKVKTGQEDQHFADFVDASIRIGRFRYAQRIAAWREVFGDAYIVRPFQRDHLLDGDILADFAHSAFGMTLAEIGLEEDDTPVANESPSLESLLLMQELVERLGCAANRADALWHEQNVLRPVRAGIDRLFNARGTRPSWPAAAAARARDAYMDDASAVDAMIGDASGGIFARALSSLAEKTAEEPDPPALEDLLRPRELKAHRAHAEALVKIVRNLRKDS